MRTADHAEPVHPPRGWRRWTPWRRLCQALVALPYLLLPWVNARGYRQVFGTLASLKLGPIDLTEPAAGLAALFASRGVQTVLLLGMAPMIALALVAGPVFCSWVCPWGLLSEGLDRLRHRVRPRQWGQRPWVRVRRLRWVTLAAVLLGGALLAVPLAAWISAPRLISVLPLEGVYLGILSPVTAGLLLALLVLEVVGPRRLWCRALCPVGALANFLRTPKTLAVAFAPARCLCPRVPLCHLHCPWGIDPRHAGRFDGCSNCMVCVDGCPSGALQPGWGATVGNRRPPEEAGARPVRLGGAWVGRIATGPLAVVKSWAAMAGRWPWR